MDNNIQPVSITYDQSSVILPVDENSFKEFMVSLLGQPESVEGMVEGSFEIDIGGFEHLNNLIDNRIDTQNLSSLLEFRAKLFFNDDSSMSFNGVQSFLDYKELRPLTCDGFIFTWSYLVKFNNKQASEKQEISILSLKKDIKTKTRKRNKSSFLLLAFDLIDEVSDNKPTITHSVRCTDKDWGIEITELTRRCLSRFVKIGSSPIVRFRQKVVDNFNVVCWSCWVLGFFLMSTFLETQRGVDLKLCRDLASKAAQYTKGNTLDKKIDFLVDLIASCNKNESSGSLFLISILPIGIFLLCSTVLPLLIYKLIELPNYRFLIFTEESKRERDAYFHRLANRKNFWVVTIFFGLLVGVAGNYIVTFLTTIVR